MVSDKRLATKVAINASLAAGAILGALLLAEAALLLGGRFPPSPRLYPGDVAAVQGEWVDSLTGWRLPRNMSRTITGPEDDSLTVVANSLGFRGPEQPLSDTASFEAAFVGDSFTFGSGVPFEQTFPSLVADQLGIAAYNYGGRGYGIDQMLMATRHVVLPRSPELVVVSFIADDLNRSLTAYRPRAGGWAAKPTFTLDDGRLVPLTPDDSPGVIWRTLERHSRLLSAWRHLQRSWYLERPFGYPWELNKKLFMAIRDEVRAARASLVVMYLPVAGLQQPAPGLAREFDELAIPFLDAAAAFPSETADTLFFESDPHMNSSGHRRVAELLVAFLRSQPCLLERGGCSESR